MQRRRVLILSGILGLLAIGGLAWYLGSPLFINREVDDHLPFEIPGPDEMEAMTEGELQTLTDDIMEKAAAMPDKPMEEDMPEALDLIVLKSGAINGADSFHQGSGTATLIELPDGSRFLRLENFMVTNGPDLHVLLATGINPSGRDDLEDYLDLGSLKGNIGNQNYELSPGIDLARYNSVVIYCVPFHVLFAHADF